MPPKASNPKLEEYIEKTMAKEPEERTARPNLLKNKVRILQELGKSEDLVKADKGSCIVVQDRSTYAAEGKAHLADTSTYKPLDSGGELFYCAWLPLRPSLKEGSQADPGDEPRVSLQSNPAGVVGSVATPPSGGLPLSGAQPPKGALPYAVIKNLMVHLHTILLTHMEPIQGFDIANMISETPFQCHITGASVIIIILDLYSCACQQSL